MMSEKNSCAIKQSSRVQKRIRLLLFHCAVIVRLCRTDFSAIRFFLQIKWSEQQDLNLRPSAPKNCVKMLTNSMVDTFFILFALVFALIVIIALVFAGTVQ